MAQGKETTRQDIKLSPAGLRAVFANFITPVAYQENGQAKGKPKYGATFIIPGALAGNDNPDFITLKTAVIELAKKTWPGKKFSTQRLTQEQVNAGDVMEIGVPWKDGTREADKGKAKGKNYEFFRGNTTFKATSDFKTALLKAGDPDPVDVKSDSPEAETLFYSGGYYAPLLTLHVYQPQDNKPGGVGAWLNAVFLVKHGDRIQGSGANHAEKFKGYAGTMSSENPTSGSGEEF